MNHTAVIKTDQMKTWIPLFELFLNSPTPDFDASLYFQQQNNPSRSSFLSLLLTPLPSPSSQNSLIFFQTLPSFVQSRILSFFSNESLLFSSHHIRSLCAHILNSSSSSVHNTDFWVHRAACNLIDVVIKDEFYDLPDFFRSSNTFTSPLPYLPISYQEFKNMTDIDPILCPSESIKDEVLFTEQEVIDSCSPISSSLDPSTCEKAIAFKTKILDAASSLEAMHIANEIHELCLGCGQHNELELLGLMEAWEADDEILAVVLANLNRECDDLVSSEWPAHVLCAVILPKFLVMKSPVSRVLLSSVISFCKLFPVAAVDALIFPLFFLKDGINVVLCDVLTRIMKECLHRCHVSAFFQKLLVLKKSERHIVCLSCHRELICDELVWTEQTFSLFQNVLNMEVYMTPDSVDEIVTVIVEKAESFSKSLKFGNFFLCFVTKCSRARNVYKDLLEEAAEMTNTFVTGSILSKLGSQ